MLLDNNNVPSYDQQNRIETKERSRCTSTHSAFAKERNPSLATVSYHKNGTTQPTDPATAGHLTTIRLELIQPHPDNPRLYPREDLISDLANHVQEQGQFLPEYAILVRPMLDGTYQIISGHHRYAAAQRAGLTAIPCWCREMSDAEAHMELALANRQDALSPLEWGLHALRTVQKGTAGRGKTGGLSEYARMVHRTKQSLSLLVQAAEVYDRVSSSLRLDDVAMLTTRTHHLIAIHKAPESTWATLVDGLLDHDWSVKETEQVVQRVTALLESRPPWWELDRQPLIANALTNEGQSQVRVFALVQELDQQLSPVTIYQHQQTDEVREIHGREHRKWEPIAESYDQQAIFRERLNGLVNFPDMQTIRAIHHEIIAFVASHAQATEQWHPIASDEEYRAQQERERVLKESTRRARYTPVLYPTEVLHGLQQLGSGSIDLIIADPPYNMGKAEWDMLGSGEDYAAWATPWLQECYRVLKETGSI